MINEKTAQQIVDAVKDVCGFNINFTNDKGIIIASTDPARIGTFHEAGKFQAHIEKMHGISVIEAKIQHLFDQIPNALFCYQYPEEFIAVLNASSFDTYQYLIKDFIEKENRTISAGIGQAQNTYQLSASFHTAETALNSLRSAESYALFDDLSLEIILGSVPEKYKKEFLLKTLHRLSPDDIALLHTYFEEGRSLTSACEKLYMHKYTLQYNLDRIYRTCGLNPRDFKDAIILYLATKIHDQ